MSDPWLERLAEVHRHAESDPARASELGQSLIDDMAAALLRAQDDLGAAKTAAEASARQLVYNRLMALGKKISTDMNRLSGRADPWHYD